MGRVALDADAVIAYLDAADDRHGRAVDLLRPLLGGRAEIAIGANVIWKCDQRLSSVAGSEHEAE